MKTHDLGNIGIPAGSCAETAKHLLQQTQSAALEDLKRVATAPATFVDDERYGRLARQLVEHSAAADRFRPRTMDASYQIWGA